MIDSALTQVASQLNEFLRRHANVTYDIVKVTNLVELNGNVVPDTDNKMLLFLVNVERETASFTAGPGRGATVARFAEATPPLHLNLAVMAAANFSGRHYPDALKFLSNTVSFFQRTPVFDHANTPDLDGRIDRLVLEIDSMDTNDLSNLWGILGGKYVPSILYKMRMVTFAASDVIAQSPPIGAQESGAVAR